MSDPHLAAPPETRRGIFHPRNTLAIFLMASAVILAWFPSGFAEDKPAPAQPDIGAVPEKEITIAKAETATPADMQYLESLAKGDDPSAVIARAALYKFDPGKYGSMFQEYFKVDRTLPKVVITPEQLNSRIKENLHDRPGMTPLEGVARLYLIFRRQGLFVRNDDTAINLEVMFRASVFQGVLGKELKDELRMAAAADGVEPPDASKDEPHSPAPAGQ